MAFIEYSDGKAYVHFKGRRYNISDGDFFEDKNGVKIKDAYFGEENGKLTNFQYKKKIFHINIESETEGIKEKNDRDNKSATSILRDMQNHSDAVVDESQKSTTNFERDTAPSPYNFIPLNDTVIHFKEDNKEPLYSGSIDLKITNLTYLFTRNKPDDSEFFTVNGKPAIPGSSIRGMLRNLCEIITYGNFNAFENRKLYLRNFAGSTSAKDYYSGRINNKNVKLGFLDFDRKSRLFVLYPIAGPDKANSISPRAQAFKYFLQANKWQIRTGKINGKRDWSVKYNADKKNKLIIDKEVIDSYKSDRTRKTFGDMEDITETAKKQKLNNGVKFSNGLPIFYTLNKDGKVKSIGHCKMHRIPYHYEIGNYHHIPEKLQTSNLDISSSIFGSYLENNTHEDSKVCHRPGKISVHDAYMDHQTEVFLGQRQLKVLGSPNPTSFQLYLNQPGEGSSYKVDKKKMKHWGSDDAFIRGYKQYWHRITKENVNHDPFVKENGKYVPRINEKVYPHPIKALKEGNTFKSKIRFKNLTAIELGALLSVIELPEGCNHKLGMAKPLGLGSVQIDLESLTIQDTAERYKKVFANDLKSWHEPNLDKPTKESLVGEFESFMKKQLNLEKSEFWEADRMKALKTMLSFDEKKNASNNWLKGTRYQIGGNEDEEYRARKVLPTPSEVSNEYL